METKNLDRFLVLLAISILFFLGFLVFKPLLIPIFLAFVLGYFFRPSFVYLYQKTKMKRLSALTIIIGILAVILIPFIMFIPTLIKQIFRIYLNIQNFNLGTVVSNILPNATDPEVVTAINIQFNNIIANLFSSVLTSLSNFLVDIPIKMFYTVIFFFIFYFILVDLDKIQQYFYELLPFSGEVKRKFSSEFKNVTDGILYGQFLIGILQGVLIGLILFILGVPGTLFLTLVAIIAGILPLVGPSVIWIPVGIYLLMAGAPIQALILVVFSNVISWITEGFVRPYILSRRTTLPIFLGFLSTIGGLFAFGLVGLLIGPMVTAYIIIVIQFYKEGRFSELFRK